jgi:UDP-N-acetylmuramoyl-tripeptide--D-alanyl-D-alanine ligase
MSDEKPLKLVALEKSLRIMATLVLKKYKPRVIGITGSVGKTSTKEAVYTVLKDHFATRTNEKNYNNEVGLPLTIIGTESGESSLLGWFKVGLSWISVMIFPHAYPEILVLEMGADRPGDIKYLTDFIKPEIGIITDISGSHLEYFKTVEGVAKEKGTLVKRLNSKGVAVLNGDNEYIQKLKSQLKSKIYTYGFSEGVDVRALDIFYNYEEETGHKAKIRGISFKLSYKGTTMPIRLNNVLAEHQIYPALAAVSCGLEMGLNLVEIAKCLGNYCPPPGRMNILEGNKGSVIIDDTYNSSPVSTQAALRVLGNIKAGRRIAVLGDMLELGPDTVSGHQNVANTFVDIRGDIFIGVGERMKLAIESLRSHAISPGRIHWFADPMSAGATLEKIIQADDLVLVKGSQGMRMEKVVEEIMAHPESAKNALCRQSMKWKERPWKPV